MYGQFTKENEMVSEDIRVCHLKKNRHATLVSDVQHNDSIFVSKFLIIGILGYCEKCKWTVTITTNSWTILCNVNVKFCIERWFTEIKIFFGQW